MADGGWIALHEGFFPGHEALLDTLVASLPLRQETVIIAGQTYPSPRLVSWHGDPGCTYRYSGRTFEPEPWTDELLAIRDRLAGPTGVVPNGVLVNYYRDGRDAMGEHSDDEPELGPTDDDRRIASVSLGAPRRFHLRHRRDKADKLMLELGGGSLLVMGGTLQSHYTHRIARTKKVVGPRLNLTYRFLRAAATPR